MFLFLYIIYFSLLVFCRKKLVIKITKQLIFKLSFSNLLRIVFSTSTDERISRANIIYSFFFGLAFVLVSLQEKNYNTRREEKKKKARHARKVLIIKKTRSHKSEKHKHKKHTIRVSLFFCHFIFIFWLLSCLRTIKKS